ncbi:MAG: ATP-binding protein, partial [Pseudomonadota bacterium]
MTKIHIYNWRHFQNIEIEFPLESKVVCLVGANGTGKSQLLELIASAAQRIGLSHGVHPARVNPFSEDASFRVEFQIDTEKLEKSAKAELQLIGRQTGWDGRLTAIQSFLGPCVLAENCGDFERARWTGSRVKDVLHNSKAVHYLMLDADRAYPRIDVSMNEIGGALQQSWDETTKQRAHVGTKSLYEEWSKYLLGIESQENGNYIAALRKAREAGEPDPP